MNLRKARMLLITSVGILLAIVLCALYWVKPLPVSASDPGSGDWPMWGGTPDRNMISNMKGLPTTWDVNKKTNVKWVATLGSQSYGNPVVAGGQVRLGTNNEERRGPQQSVAAGVVMALGQKTRRYLSRLCQGTL